MSRACSAGVGSDLGDGLGPPGLGGERLTEDGVGRAPREGPRAALSDSNVSLEITSSAYHAEPRGETPGGNGSYPVATCNSSRSERWGSADPFGPIATSNSAANWAT
jgi:hypothetical protein